MDNISNLKITGQIITIDKILEASDYMQNIVKHYNDLIKEDKQKNQNAFLNDANYNYYSFSNNRVEYTINFLDGRTLKTEDEYVFKDEVKEPKYIKSMTLYLYVGYVDNTMNERTDHKLSIFLSIWNEHVDMNVSSKHMDEEMNNAHSYIKGIFEKGEERNNKIVKNRNLIKLLFSLAVGSILSYIPIIILFVINYSDNTGTSFILNNGIVFEILHWFIIFIVGTFLGYPIMNNLYNKIEPEKFNLGADYQARKQEEFETGNEILFGDRVNNLEKRATIEKYYELSKKIILVQVVISIISMVVLTIINR